MGNELNLNDFFDEGVMMGAIAEANTKKFWRPQKDRTAIRILPPINQNGEKLFYFNHRVHWVNKMPYECLNQTMTDKDGNLHQAEACPICRLAKQLYKMGESDPESLQLAKDISAKTKPVVRIVIRGEADEGTVYFYELPFKVHQYLISNISSGDWGSVVHPVSGRDFVLQKTGSGKMTDYSSSSLSPKVTPIFADKDKMLETLKEAVEKKYGSLITFQTVESLTGVVKEMVNPSPAPTTAPKTGYQPMQKSQQAPKQTHAPKTDPVEEMFGDEEFELPDLDEGSGNSELDNLLKDFGIDTDEEISF